MFQAIKSTLLCMNMDNVEQIEMCSVQLMRQHGGAVVRTVASPQEGPEFNSRFGPGVSLLDRSHA